MGQEQWLGTGRGKDRRAVTVVTCPLCGGIELRRQQRERGGAAYFACKSCDHRWKDLSQTTSMLVYIAKHS